MTCVFARSVYNIYKFVLDRYWGLVEITVSIVDDDTHTRKILASWLRRAEGFLCVSDFASGADAMPHLEQEKPAVVLMDINMPGLSGIECVRQLKHRLPDTQFVMLTVYEDADHIFDALVAGASGYLLKRTTREELLSAIREVHAGGSPMTSDIARKVVQSFHSPAQGNAPHPTDGDLSPREREVLELLARGYLYKEIADELDLGVSTVSTYIRRMYEKLQVRSRSQAVARYAGGTSGEDRRIKE